MGLGQGVRYNTECAWSDERYILNVLGQVEGTYRMCLDYIDAMDCRTNNNIRLH